MNAAPKKLRNCRYCGKQHEPRQCPAYGKECNFCHKMNHFSTVCQSRSQQQAGSRLRQVRGINEAQYDSDDDEKFLHISTIDANINSSNDTKAPIIMINGNGAKSTVMCKLDTGAEANVIATTIYDTLCLGPPRQCNIKLCGFGNSIVRPLGVVTIRCFDKRDRYFDLPFYVTDVIDTVILGERACFTLNLLKRVDVLRPEIPLTLAQMQSEYADLFTGIGMYEREYHIQLQDNAQGVIQPPRKIPYALRPKLKAALDKLTQDDIIADVDCLTDWVNNLVIVQKSNNSLRLCLDPKPLNSVIKRECYAIPTPADVQAQLSGNNLFTVIDMKDAYWHVKLSDASSYLTTFHTPWGRKRFLRMPFGLSSASEVMQKRNEEIFGTIDGVHVIADDLIIAASSPQQHDAILKTVLEKARQKGVRFNKEKIQLRVNAVEYTSNLVTHEGLKPDKTKLEAIINMPPPTDIPSFQRLLGMTKYLSQYIPMESTITAPLRLLVKKGVPWEWTAQQDDALAQLKSLLGSPPVLAYYDVTKPVTIQADASQTGLGACLIQEKKPITYASRSMTPAEKNYAQIEKELLSIVFAVQKFHQYVYGKETVQVESDHKPLEAIMRKPLCKAPPRLQRLMLKLQPYDLSITYVPGKHMYMADTLSRAYLESEPSETLNDELTYVVHSLVTNLSVTAAKLAEFQRATIEDPVLQKVSSLCHTGWPRGAKNVPIDVRKYWNIRDELHVVDGIVFKIDCIVVPASLRQSMLVLIHESHLVMNKCKNRARSLLYWPGMTNDIEDMISNCTVCCKFKNSRPKEPI